MSYGTISRTPWALLAYTVSDDKGSHADIDDSLSEELHAICLAADFNQVSIATQVDFQKIRGVFRASITSADLPDGRYEHAHPTKNPLWQRILSGIDTYRSKLHLHRDHHETDAATAGVVLDFLRFGRDECQPARQVLFFYGHAYGPMGMFFDRVSRKMPPHPLRLNDLASSIVADGCHAEIVVFRDCFMDSLETACQLRGAADFMIASQSVVPIAGIWPWRDVLAALGPEVPSDQIAHALARQLFAFLDVPANRGPFADAPIALIDIEATAAVVEPLKALVAALEDARADHTRRERCAAAMESARIGFPDDHSDPGDPAMVDVLTMATALRALAPDPVAGPAAALADVVSNQVVRWQHSQRGLYKGISMYYKPATQALIDRSFIEAGDGADQKRDAAAYRQLRMNVETGWDRIALHPLKPAVAGV